MKREIQNILALVVAMVTVVVASVGAMASTVRLQFDLDRTPGAITQSVSSPGLAVGPFTALDTTWNGVNTTATNYTTLKYSDGTAATGVVAQLGSVGTTGTATSTITWNNNAALGDQATAGNGGDSLYTGDNMVENVDYFSTNATNHTGGAIGLQVSGLAPGVYAVYVTAVNTAGFNRTYNIGVGVDLTQQVGSPTVVLQPDATTTTWQAGKNYALVSSIGIYSTSDWLSVISSGLDHQFPVIDGIQIVQTSVPEPSSMALLGASTVLLARRRGRAARV